ncbi:MAG TPA: hypothetical protein VFZ66_13565 [Herpetosiphonaceae bacterium]
MTHTQYLGRVDQAAAETPTTPIKASQEPASPQPAPLAAPDRPAWRKLVQPVRIGSGKKVHLTLPDSAATTLCGRALGNDALRVAFFQYDDCGRCRSRAASLGRICAHCGEPLILQGAPGLCPSCTAALQRAS